MQAPYVLSETSTRHAAGRVAEDRGCRMAGPASRAEAAAGSRYLVLVDKLSQSLQGRCLLLLSLAALATSSMQ